MQGYHRMYAEGMDCTCTIGFTPLVKSHFPNSSERTRATHFLLAGCVLASAGLATLSWPLLPPERSEGGAQLARPAQRFAALSWASPAAVDVASRKSSPHGIDAPRTGAPLQSWGAERVVPSVREEGVMLVSPAPMGALANSKSVSAITIEVHRVAIAPAPITRPLAPYRQAENGTRRDGDLESVTEKPTRPTGVHQYAGTGPTSDSPPYVASETETKPVSMPISLVDLTGQDRTAHLTVSPAQLTVHTAAIDVMPLDEAHSIEVPAESEPVPPDASDVVRISLAKPMPEPGPGGGSPQSPATVGETKQALLSASLEFTDQDGAGHFTASPMETIARTAGRAGNLQVTEASPTEMPAESRPIRPIRPNTVHVPPLSATNSSHPSADRVIHRKVDIEQVAESVERSPHLAQLHGLGWRDGGNTTLAAKVDAMQVPAFVLADQELAALRTEAPVEMTVRLGGEAVGKVAFRMAETRTIEIQLSGLLDLVADRLAPDEFVRLRASAAAESFVSMHQLRAIGLSLRYDPVYDELLISA